MKKILTILTLIFSISAFAEITLDNTFPGGIVYPITLENSGYKEYVVDYYTNVVRIYNSDHSIYKTITVAVPNGAYLYWVDNITESLFNTDNLLEMAVTFSTTTNSITTYSAKIINENGNELLDLPDAYSLFTKNINNNAKLFVYYFTYDATNSIYTYTSSIYNLPGTIQSIDNNSSMPQNIKLNQSFPNPCNGTATIGYSLPANVKQAEIQIYNSNGQLLRQYPVDRTYNNLRLNTVDFPTGVYFYTVKTDAGIITPKQMVIIK